MVRLMDRDRTRLGGAGADSIRPLALLAPFGPDDQARTDEHFAQIGIDLFAQNDARRVREQQRIAGPGDLLVEGVHFGARDLHQIFMRVLQVAQADGVEDRRLVIARRIEFELVQAAPPGNVDFRRQLRRDGKRRRLLAGHPQDQIGMNICSGNHVFPRC